MPNPESAINRPAIEAIEREEAALLERVNAEALRPGHPTAREVPWVEQQDNEPAVPRRQRLSIRA